MQTGLFIVQKKCTNSSNKNLEKILPAYVKGYWTKV